MSNRLFKLLLAVLVTACTVPLAHAQIRWLDYQDGSYIGVQVLRPVFANDQGYTAASSTAILEGRVAVSERVSVMFDVPLGYASQNPNELIRDGEFDQLGIGNPYVGLIVRRPRSSIEAGVRFPIVGDDLVHNNWEALTTGFFAEAAEAPERYASNMMCAQVLGTVRLPVLRTMEVRLTAGPAMAYVVPDQQWLSDRATFFMRTGVQFWDSAGPLDMAVGVASFTNIDTCEECSLADRMLSQATLSLSLNAARVKPGIQARLPLDKHLSEMVQATFGLHLAVSLDR